MCTYIIPIAKGPDKDQSDPANYRGITLLSNISKLFEKLILLKLRSIDLHLNPLQGGLRPGYSALHTAFIFQEAVQSIRETGKKAYVALIDVKKAFDTVWHQGLFVKLHRKGVPSRIWHIVKNCHGTPPLPALSKWKTPTHGHSPLYKVFGRVQSSLHCSIPFM